MKQEIPNPFPNSDCFFCGQDNPLGLKLRFFWDDENRESSTEYVPPRSFVGQGNILHGAIQMGLLDEIMGWTSFTVSKQRAVTSEIRVRFLKPVYINGTSLTITCRTTSIEGPKVLMEATLADCHGAACTTATGTFHLLPPERYERLIQGV